MAGGDAGPDLIVTGDVYDPNTFELVLSGTLLTGEVVAAGSSSVTTNTAAFDFRFTVTGGLLITEGHWPAGQDIGVFLTSTNSSFYPNRCSANFTGRPLGSLGPIAPALPGQTGTKLYYMHIDHLGTPRALTDEAGNAVWRATYDPFGQATVDEDPDGDGVSVENNVRQPGQYFDGETGLHYNWMRYYDPKTGRYISSDPIGLAGGLNTYLYARANPLRYIDPTGLDIRYENTTSVYGLHQRTSVDIPRDRQVIIGNNIIRDKFGISFGLRDENAPQQGFLEALGDIPGFGKAGSGLVYPDVRDPTTKIQETFVTTPEEDILAIQYLLQQLNKTAKYNAGSNSCRNYSKDQFEAVKNLIEQKRIQERIKPIGEVYIRE